MEVVVNYGVGGAPLAQHSPSPVWSDVRVLIVDSDLQNLMNLKWMFEQCGYNNVAYLQTVEDALWLLGHSPVDLLLCEAFLPTTTTNTINHIGGGFQLLSAVRQDLGKCLDLQVVLYSSSHDDVMGLGHEMAIRALELGASAFYSNPISMELVQHLWQYVFLHKKIQSCSNYEIIPLPQPQPIWNVERPESCFTNNNPEVSEKKIDKYDEVELRGLMMKSNRMKKKNQRMRWTEDLDRKFVAAIDEIRRTDPNGGVTASRIRALMKGMGEEGLTIPQITSHLQKYNNSIKRSSCAADSADHHYTTTTTPGLQQQQLRDGDGVAAAAAAAAAGEDSSVLLLQEWSNADIEELMMDGHLDLSH